MIVRRESVRGRVSESEKSKEGYTTFYTLAVCVWYLVFTLYAYNFEFVSSSIACDTAGSMVGRVPLRELGERRGRRLVAKLSDSQDARRTFDIKDLASAETCSGYLTSTRHIRDCTTIIRLFCTKSHLYHPDPWIQMAHGHIRARKLILPAPEISSDHMKNSPRHLPLVHMVDPVSSRAIRTTMSLLSYVV